MGCETMTVKLEQYRIFKAIADTGNISRTAKQLYLSQSAVSQSLQQIESALGVRLFSRTARGVTLTAEGSVLYDYAEQALSLLEAGEARIAQSRELLKGELSIGVSSTLTKYYLLPFLRDYHQQYPHIHVRILNGTSRRVLQLLGSFIKVGPFAVSLVLIPIVVGAAVYGVKAGAWLGFVFGVVVTIAVVTGADAGGYIMFSARPVMTVIVCLLKGTAAGYVAGLVYRAISKKNALAGVIVAAAAAPVVNTGLFVLAMLLFYQPQLQAWAGDTAVATYIVTGLVGVNFLLELGVNLVLSPTITRLIAAGKKGPVD